MILPKRTVSDKVLPDKQFKFKESRYITLFVVSGSIKKFSSIDCVNTYFSQSIANYLFSIFISIGLKL